MFTLLHLLGYVTAGAAFLFVTLSLASGLLWLSEVIEEHARVAKNFGLRAIYTIIFLHILLWLVDSLSLPRILFSILCHVVYLTNFTPAWPLISLTSLSFIGSCTLVLADHFVWFFYFSERSQAARRAGFRNNSQNAPWRPASDVAPLTFMEIATFFAVCVWLVPLFLFLSLSANDNALPTSSNEKPPYSPSPLRQSSLPKEDDAPSRMQRLQSVAPSRLNIPGASRSTLFQNIAGPAMGFLSSLRGRRSSRDPDGIIAPRTPRSASPIPSPSAPSPWLNSSPSSPSRFAAFQNEGMMSGTPRSPTTTRHMPPPLRRATSDGIGMGSLSISSSSTILDVPPSGRKGSVRSMSGAGGGRRRMVISEEE